MNAYVKEGEEDKIERPKVLEYNYYIKNNVREVKP